jgi:hypothetical protein
MNRFVFVAVFLALVVSACGARATPTIDALQVQAYAQAAAATMLAETQAAIPTNTPEPPTPLPSPTPLASPTVALAPTLAGLPSPTLASSSDSSDCNHHVLDVGAAGAQAPVLIRNDTRGPIQFSMGLSTKNSYGQCGYLGWNIAKGQSIMVSVPLTRTNQGDPCYWAAANILDPKRPTTVSGGGCINNGDKWTFDVGYDRIKLTPP